MTKQIRLIAMTLLTAVGLSITAPQVAEAGSKGRRNTAIGLGAVAVYGVVKKKPLIAGLAGGGAIYSYMRSRQAAKDERSRRLARARSYRYSRAAAARRSRYTRTRSYRSRYARR